jgi:hypothetical protein
VDNVDLAALDMSPDPRALPSFIATCALGLERAALAVDAFRGLPTEDSRLAGLAAGLALAGDVEGASAAATRALEVAVRSDRPMRQRRVEAVRRRYLPADHPAVRRFDDRFRELVTG